MSLLTNKLSTRQSVMALSIALTLADFTSTEGGKTANVINIPMPIGAEVVGGHVVVDEVFNGTGTDVLDVGDASSGNRYANDINLEALARTALTLTGFVSTSTQPNIVLTRVPGGSDSTTGEIHLVILYVEQGKGIYQYG